MNFQVFSSFIALVIPATVNANELYNANEKQKQKQKLKAIGLLQPAIFP